jgi:S-DNA-T family DNA segregation ATPase FtsK/SpoIIIE
VTTSLEQAIYDKCVEAVKKEGRASVQVLQQACKCSWDGALIFLDRMEREGIVSPPDNFGLRALI